MAEAVVEERPVQNFYCHRCKVHFESVTTTSTCPHCSDGFVEELIDQPASTDADRDDEWEDDSVAISSLADDWPMPMPMSEEQGGDVIMAGWGPREERRTGRSRSLDGNRPGMRAISRIATMDPNQRTAMSFENFIHDVIVNLGVGLGNAANMQLLLGNPGDYAWGREGLDTIITQLLNQMDSTGPPPVSKAVIDALPVVPITTEQTAMKLQCSVCWEDFVLNEMVRQLPCLHVYHEPCIRPWLELHGTCPICRQNLGSGNSDQPNQEPENDGGGSGGGGIRLLPFSNIVYEVQSNMAPYGGGGSSSSSSSDNSDSSRTSLSNCDSTM